MTTTLLHDLHHTALAVRGVLRRQALRLDAADAVIETPFVPEAGLAAAWNTLFGLPAAAPALPFLYHSPLNARAMHAFLDRLGVNFRNILHLRTELRFGEAYRRAPLAHGRTTHRVVIEDIVRLRADRAAIVFRATLHDAGGRLLCEERETFAVLRLSPADAARLEAHPRFGRSAPADLRGLSRRASRLAGGDAELATLEVARDLGVRYGRLSGDMNVVHTSDRLCRLFGHERAFVQGLCTAQAILARLAKAHGEAPEALTVDYCRPVYVGQRATLALAGDLAELRDAEGRVLAVATRRPAALPCAA